ncbi:MAG: type II secretion system major pseudopilin GspG [Bacillota bacterium]|jgi:general secretion pathway protein G
MQERKGWQYRQSERGFTLLEILGVLTLLAAIITLVAPNVIKQVQKGQIKTAIAQVGSIKSVINAYYMDNGQYPSTDQGLKALIEAPTIPPVPENWGGPYIDDGKIPKDPWGRELHYKQPGDRNKNGYDVYTLGSDNKEGGTGVNADIGNW